MLETKAVIYNSHINYLMKPAGAYNNVRWSDTNTCSHHDHYTTAAAAAQIMTPIATYVFKQLPRTPLETTSIQWPSSPIAGECSSCVNISRASHDQPYGRQ